MAEPVPSNPQVLERDPKVGRWEPSSAAVSAEGAPAAKPEPVREIGGRKDGPDPTRYGDWEKNGRCIDF